MIKRMNNRKVNFKRALSLVAVACLLSITAVNAQELEGPGGPGDGGDLGGETGVPFDGGVSLLVAAGIVYGAKKAYDAKKKGAVASTEEEAML
jgi:hypothetical protein